MLCGPCPPSLTRPSRCSSAQRLRRRSRLPQHRDPSQRPRCRTVCPRRDRSPWRSPASARSRSHVACRSSRLASTPNASRSMVAPKASSTAAPRVRDASRGRHPNRERRSRHRGGRHRADRPRSTACEATPASRSRVVARARRRARSTRARPSRSSRRGDRAACSPSARPVPACSARRTDDADALRPRRARAADTAG